MISPTARHLLCATLGVCFLAGSGAMARYYFTYDANHTKIREETKTRIADRLTAKWLKPDLSGIEKQFSDGPLDKFDMLILNTAMGRWRVQDKAPHAYNRLISDFPNGWWNDSFVDELTPMLETMDEAWRHERRQQTSATKKAAMPDLIHRENVGFSLKFPSGTTTPEVGSLIEVLFMAEREWKPQQPATGYWVTEQNPDFSPWRCRLCTLTDTKQTSGGKAIFRLRMDMSDSPEWIYTDTQPTWINFGGEPPINWVPFAISMGDSPWLEVATTSTSHKRILKPE